MKLLVKYSDNYADEFDIEGFAILEENQWYDIQKTVRTKVKFPNEYCFGSNENIEYESAEDFLQTFTVINITDTLAELISMAFQLRPYDGIMSFGKFPNQLFEPDLTDEEINENYILDANERLLNAAMYISFLNSTQLQALAELQKKPKLDSYGKEEYKEIRQSFYTMLNELAKEKF